MVIFNRCSAKVSGLIYGGKTDYINQHDKVLLLSEQNNKQNRSIKITQKIYITSVIELS